MISARPTTLRTCLGVVCLSTLVLLGFMPTRVAQSLSVELRTDRPSSYLEAGELLAANAETDEELTMAQQVLAMGIAMASSAGEDSVASSCAIALADASGDSDIARELWDLALLLDPSRVSAWVRNRAVSQSDPQNLIAATCVYFARQADGDEANARYSQRPIKALIRTAADELGFDPMAVHNTINTLIVHAQEDACRGRVFVSRAVDGESIRLVCPDHQRPIGVAASDDALLELLSIELHLMGESGMLRSWGGTSMMKLDTPARIPSVQGMAQRFGVDPMRPYWVDGRWSATPSP